MSRSIHTTRKDIEEAERAEYADAQVRADEINKLRDEIKKKRRIKSRVSSERNDEPECQIPTTPESIPIIVREDGEYIHYPASRDDLFGVIDLLPAGVLDGLESIELSTGNEKQAEYEPEYSEMEPDPLTGRIGTETLPGIYTGNCLGIYRPRLNRISVFAYVYDGNLPNRAMWEVYLRLQMLSTFVHEVAHHYDFTTRTSRGRWLMDDKTKAEIYAETVQHDWVQNYVIPYLQKAYPQELKSLDDWINHHGGISMPIAMLAGRPRPNAKDDVVYIESMFSIQSAFTGLVKDVAEGKSLTDTRIQFARYLHYSANYVEALEILEKVLSSEPENLEVTTLKADIYCHEKKYDQSLPLVELVLAADQTYLDAWQILADIREAQHNWEAMLAAVTYILDHFELNILSAAHYLLDSARAHKELGDIASMELDIVDVEAIEWSIGRTPLYIQRRIRELREQ